MGVQINFELEWLSPINHMKILELNWNTSLLQRNNNYTGRTLTRRATYTGEILDNDHKDEDDLAR